MTSHHFVQLSFAQEKNEQKRYPGLSKTRKISNLPILLYLPEKPNRRNVLPLFFCHLFDPYKTTPLDCILLSLKPQDGQPFSLESRQPKEDRNSSFLSFSFEEVANPYPQFHTALYSQGKRAVPSSWRMAHAKWAAQLAGAKGVASTVGCKDS